MDLRRLFSLLLALNLGRTFFTLAAENTVPLPTELKVSSVAVSIRVPLGLRYRPGSLFPLEIQITNPGAPMDAEITAVEGDAAAPGSWAERGVVPPPVTLPSGTTRFLLPMRAPGVSANITLVVRGGLTQQAPAVQEDGAKAELFRASLSRVLHPLPSGGRVIIFCGGGTSNVWPQDQATRLSSHELPADDWMWESVDWLVLNDGSIGDASAESRAAIKRWLCGGGRLFLRTREALGAALKLGFTPLDARSDVPADVNWWTKNAGLKTEDVLATKNFRPVYARLRVGFGQVVFVFPGSQSADADEAAVFNRPDLQRHRDALPDARVQPERFAAFAPASISETQRRTVMVWATLGALIVCAGLIYARSSRSRIEAALVPFGAGALLMALLANGFPRQELTVSRVVFESRSADCRAEIHDEFAFLEAFRRPVSISAHGANVGTLTPLFDELDDLRTANVDRSVKDGALTLQAVAVAPNQPALLQSIQVNVDETRTDSETRARRLKQIQILKPAESISVESAIFKAMNRKQAIWIQKNREVLLLRETVSGYTAEAFALSALERLLTESTESNVAKAHATALKWAVDTALVEGGGALIIWSDTSPQAAPSIVIQGAPLKVGDEWTVRTVPVH